MDFFSSLLGISVEDVTAYFKLAEDIAGISQEAYKLEVLKELANSVHPLALGNVQRVYMQIRQLAYNLLALHMNEEANLPKIEKIIKALTQEFFSHTHAISRKEAITLLGDWVRGSREEEEPIIWELFNSYVDDTNLRGRFNLPEYMGDHLTRDLTVIGAYLESRELSHIHITDLQILQRPNLPPNIQVQVPPGNPIPLVPWAGRTFDYGIKRLGWNVNERGV